MATEPPPQRARRTVRGRRAEADGRAAEALAAAALQAAGWTILDRRARTDAGELDLVARRGAVLAFVEVKRRRGAEEALFALSPRQRRRLAAAAACWLESRPDAAAGADIRFDVMAIAPGLPPRHLENAWTPGLDDSPTDDFF